MGVRPSAVVREETLSRKMMKAELYLTQKCSKTMLGHPKYRHKEEKKKMLKMSFKKLQKMEDPESLLCKAVLINNTLKYLQNKGATVNNNYTEYKEDINNDRTEMINCRITDSDTSKEYTNMETTNEMKNNDLIDNFENNNNEENKEKTDILKTYYDELDNSDKEEKKISNKASTSSDSIFCNNSLTSESSCITKHSITNINMVI